MKRTINFGKVAYSGKKKINPVDVTIELRDRDWGKEFSAVGYLWKPNRSDCYLGGQCLDSLAEYIDDPLFDETYRFWKLYHLNGMHAGTIEQEEALDEWFEKEGIRYDYSLACAYLKSIGLFEVEYNGEPYQYGHGWLKREIPEEDLARIEEIIREGK